MSDKFRWDRLTTLAIWVPLAFVAISGPNIVWAVLVGWYACIAFTYTFDPIDAWWERKRKSYRTPADATDRAAVTPERADSVSHKVLP